MELLFVSAEYFGVMVAFLSRILAIFASKYSFFRKKTLKYLVNPKKSSTFAPAFAKKEGCHSSVGRAKD